MKTLLILFQAGWRRRYVICLPILIMPIFGFIIGVVSAKKYETRTTLLIQESSMMNPFMKDLTVATNLKKRMESLNALLHSHHILSDVAFKMKMITEDTDHSEKVRVIQELSRSLQARLVGNEIVEIKYVSKDPSEMVDTLNEVTLRFLEKIIAPQRSSIFKSEDFLKKEIDKKKVGLIEAEAKLADYKSQHASGLPELHARNVIRLSQFKDDLSERRTLLKGAKAERNSLKSRLSQTNPVVGQIEQQLVELMGELALLRSRYQDEHSSIRGVLRKISSLQQQRAEAMEAKDSLTNETMERLWDRASNIESSDENMPLLIEQLKQLQDIENRIQSLEEEVKNLETEYANVEKIVREYGEHEKQIETLKRDINVKRQIYEDLAKRHQLAIVTGALGKFEESDQIKMVDPPFQPTKPSNLPLLVQIIAGLFAGIFLGFGMAAILEIIDTSIHTQDELEKLTGLKVLIRLPLQKAIGFDELTGDLDFIIDKPKAENITNLTALMQRP